MAVKEVTYKLLPPERIAHLIIAGPVEGFDAFASVAGPMGR